MGGCWRSRLSARCCALAGCGWTRRSWRRISAARPIPGCARMPSRGWRGWRSGSRRRGSRRGAACATGAARSASGCGRSRRRACLAGERARPTTGRRVSLADPDARPIRMGSPRRPTEFGYKARVADSAEGFVIADVPDRGAPVDAGLLEGAIAKAKRAGMQVRTVYADRGFGTSTGDAALARHRIRDPVIPRQQRAAPIERSRNWKRRYRFRTGLAGRISQLKRKGLRRTRLRSLEGAQTWVGSITLAHNLQRMALLT